MILCIIFADTFLILRTLGLLLNFSFVSVYHVCRSCRNAARSSFCLNVSSNRSPEGEVWMAAKNEGDSIPFPRCVNLDVWRQRDKGRSGNVREESSGYNGNSSAKLSSLSQGGGCGERERERENDMVS